MLPVTLRVPVIPALRLGVVVSMAIGSALEAQGLPMYEPINPMATSRSGVYFQPYRDPAPGKWAVDFGLDYASTIEYNRPEDADYVLDSELLRVNVAVSRNIGAQGFVRADLGVRGAYNGFLDGFFDWYHDVLGIRLMERDNRPQDEFLYLVEPAGMAPMERRAGDLFLSDLRLGAGWRYSPNAQGVISLTLPTATGPAGYGRGVISASILHALRKPLSRRFMYEGSVGVGYTPTHGQLAPLQREGFLAASSGLRARIWGRQALYANLFYHSSYYRSTALPALDRYELSLDFGWVLTSCHGREWRLGLTEDPKPSGPGIDVMLRLGVAFRRGTAPCAAAGIPSNPSPED